MFAKRVYTWAAYWGFLNVIPLWFLEGETTRILGRPMTYPEWYYGFAAVVLSYQVIYLTIGRDPVRFRPIMPLAIAAKLGFGVTVWILVALGRTSPLIGAVAVPDLIWMLFFILAWRATPKS